jgi:hypothetical protein
MIVSQERGPAGTQLGLVLHRPARKEPREHNQQQGSDQQPGAPGPALDQRQLAAERRS